MLFKDRRRNEANRKGNTQRHKDQIVEIAKHWEEIRNQVDWTACVGDHTCGHDFGIPRYLGIPDGKGQRNDVALQGACPLLETLEEGYWLTPQKRSAGTLTAPGGARLLGRVPRSNRLFCSLSKTGKILCTPLTCLLILARVGQLFQRVLSDRFQQGIAHSMPDLQDPYKAMFDECLQLTDKISAIPIRDKLSRFKCPIVNKDAKPGEVALLGWG
jgi:hypothetical protein